MNQTAFITKGDEVINQLICNELLEKGYDVHLQFYSKKSADDYTNALQEDWKGKFVAVVNIMDQAKDIPQMMEEAVANMGSISLFIHGNEWINEEMLFEDEGSVFGDFMNAQFHQLFMWNHHVSLVMTKQRYGQIMFPLLSDTLYYVDYPSSPILNHGKISMMKCLSRELTPFGIRVNAITFGYYDVAEDRESRKVLKKKLEIYALKPPVPKLEEMIPAISLYLQKSDVAISGQNFHIGAGMETFI